MDVKTRRIELKKLIENVGIHNLNRAQMARRFGVTATQINRDIKSIMSEMPAVNWVSIFNQARQDFDRTIEIASKTMDNTKDNKLRAKLAGQISEMLLRKMSFLEKMERLLPAGAKPEPVTILYKYTDNTTLSPDDAGNDEKEEEKQSIEENEENILREGEHSEKCRLP